MASKLSFNLKAPKPPSREETNANTARTLTWIQDRIAEIYALEHPEQQQGDDRGAYLDIYNAVHDYTVATRHPPTGSVGGEELYRSLERGIKAFCQQSLGYLDCAPRVLEAYVKQWTTFKDISKRAARLFQSHERQWLRRQIAEKGEGIYNLQELHLVTWKAEVLGSGSTKILDAMVELQQGVDGSGAQGEESAKLLQECLASLTEVNHELSNGSLVGLKQVIDGERKPAS